MKQQIAVMAFAPVASAMGIYEFNLKVPRTRQGSFYPVLLAVIKREDEEQIGEVAEELYGKHYSKQKVSYLSRACVEEVEALLNRELSNRYLVAFIMRVRDKFSIVTELCRGVEKVCWNANVFA